MLFLDTTITCSDPGLAIILNIMKKFMLLIQLIVPILLIISVIVSFAKLVKNPNLKNGKMKIIHQFLATAIVFFIPLLR